MNPIQKKRRKFSYEEKYETDETKRLSNSQLHRLVLIEQLELIRLKKKRLQEKAANDCDKNNFSGLSEDSLYTDCINDSS